MPSEGRIGKIGEFLEELMLSWQEIVDNYIVKYSNQIRKTTQSLRDCFGITYFTYHRIDTNGNYTVLVDRPDWAERYVGDKIYLNDPYLRHPQVYRSGTTLLESYGSEEYKEIVMKAGKKVLNADLGVQLIQKHEECVEFFGFAGTRETSCLENLYLNHSQLLKSFAEHFKREMKPILTKMGEEPGSLQELKGADFFCGEVICPDIERTSRLKFLKSLGMHLEVSKAEKLSPRERECLLLLIEGKSSKESAAFLKLSSRTIEGYFENIKDKFSCWSKPEVLAIAKELQKLGLL